jgi:hypothetical protein
MAREVAAIVERVFVAMIGLGSFSTESAGLACHWISL